MHHHRQTVHPAFLTQAASRRAQDASPQVRFHNRAKQQTSAAAGGHLRAARACAELTPTGATKTVPAYPGKTAGCLRTLLAAARSPATADVGAIVLRWRATGHERYRVAS